MALHYTSRCLRYQLLSTVWNLQHSGKDHQLYATNAFHTPVRLCGFITWSSLAIIWIHKTWICHSNLLKSMQPFIDVTDPNTTNEPSAFKYSQSFCCMQNTAKLLLSLKTFICSITLICVLLLTSLSLQLQNKRLGVFLMHLTTVPSLEDPAEVWLLLLSIHFN